MSDIYYITSCSSLFHSSSIQERAGLKPKVGVAFAFDLTCGFNGVISDIAHKIIHAGGRSAYLDVHKVSFKKRMLYYVCPLSISALSLALFVYFFSSRVLRLENIKLQAPPIQFSKFELIKYASGTAYLYWQENRIGLTGKEQRQIYLKSSGASGEDYFYCTWAFSCALASAVATRVLFKNIELVQLLSPAMVTIAQRRLNWVRVGEEESRLQNFLDKVWRGAVFVSFSQSLISLHSFVALGPNALLAQAVFAITTEFFARASAHAIKDGGVLYYLSLPSWEYFDREG